MRVLLKAAVALPLFTTAAFAGVIIDDFSNGAMSAQACAPPLGAPGTTAGPIAAAGTLSGDRIINSQVTALLGTSAGCSTAAVLSSGPVLDIANAFGVFGKTTLTWDVPGAIDLSGNDFFSLDVRLTGGISPNDTVTFTTLFCSDDACTNRFERVFQISGTVDPSENRQFAISGFAANGAPNWNSITRASLVIDSGNSSDLQIDNIMLDSAVPEPATLSLVAAAFAGLALLRRR